MAKAAETEENELICKCFQVTEAEIRTCIAEHEIIKIEDVTNQCDAGGNCQTCHILIQLFIDQHQQDKTSEKTPEPVSAKITNKGFFGKLFANS
jgi:NifU-like protein